MSSDPGEPARSGRPRDPSRDQAILDATLDLLAEVGYERMTVREIARRSGTGLATLYRRWPTKVDLVVDALAGMQPAALADPGPGADARTTLVTALQQFADNVQGRTSALLPGIIGQMPNHPELADALRSSVVEPRLAAVTTLLDALPGVDSSRTPRAAQLLPAWVFFKVLILGEEVTEDDLRTLVELVALAATSPTTEPDTGNGPT